MVGTAKETKSDPVFTSKRTAALTSPTRDLNKVVTRFAATLEPPRDVIGQRQAPLNDLVPVPLEFR